MTDPSAGAMQALIDGYNVLGGLAAPRVFQRSFEAAPEFATLREAIDEALARYLEVARRLAAATTDGQPRAEPVSEVEEIRRLLIYWQGGVPLPAAIILAARRALAQIGAPEPPEGWDAWEGPPEGASEAGDEPDEPRR